MLRERSREISQNEVGGAALGYSCFSASDHGPVSFRRVGQPVALPLKHDVGAMTFEARVKMALPEAVEPTPQPQRVSPVLRLHARGARVVRGP
ncbi:hypothetical protein HOK021_22980 [Streptomyces hygroscopicus]|nr:hypothetical protein HOK021_22980 [Streptomyces hygroscopicus]